MHILTEPDCIDASVVAGGRVRLAYPDGADSVIPYDFFRNWIGEQNAAGYFEIGKCSYIAFGSLAIYFPEDDQSTLGRISIGRFCSCGPEVRFLQNQEHWTHTISTFPLHGILDVKDPPRLPSCHTVIKNDVWIGSQAMINGGSCTENGCIIGSRALLPRNFRSEPYGIYVGSPARLKKFRFEEPVRELLLELAWWEMPLPWIKQQSRFFGVDLNKDRGLAIELLQEMLESKRSFLARFPKETNGTAADSLKEVHVQGGQTVQFTAHSPASTQETAAPERIFEADEIANFEEIIAVYRANPGHQEAVQQVGALRQGIADFILNLEPGRLKALYEAEIGTVCQLLLQSGFQREPISPEEEPVVRSLREVFCGPPRQVINTPLLVCYMLYCQPSKDAMPIALEKIPAWLREDYQAWSGMAL